MEIKLLFTLIEGGYGNLTQEALNQVKKKKLLKIRLYKNTHKNTYGLTRDTELGKTNLVLKSTKSGKKL